MDHSLVRLASETEEKRGRGRHGRDSETERVGRACVRARERSPGRLLGTRDVRARNCVPVLKLFISPTMRAPDTARPPLERQQHRARGMIMHRSASHYTYVPGILPPPPRSLPLTDYLHPSRFFILLRLSMFSIFLFFFILIIVASVRRLHHPVLASYIFRSPFLVSKCLYFFRIPKEEIFLLMMISGIFLGSALSIY